MILAIHKLPSKHRNGDSINTFRGMFTSHRYFDEYISIGGSQYTYTDKLSLYKVVAEEFGKLYEMVVCAPKEIPQPHLSDCFPLYQKIFGEDTYIYISGINRAREICDSPNIISNRQRFVNDCRNTILGYSPDTMVLSQLDNILQDHWKEISGMIAYSDLNGWVDGQAYIYERFDMFDTFEEFTPEEFCLHGDRLDPRSKHILRRGTCPMNENHERYRKENQFTKLNGLKNWLPKSFSGNLEDHSGALLEIIDGLAMSNYTDIGIKISKKEHVVRLFNRYTNDVSHSTESSLFSTVKYLMNSFGDVVEMEFFKTWEEEGYVKMVNNHNKSFVTYFSIPQLVINHWSFWDATDYHNACLTILT